MKRPESVPAGSRGAALWIAATAEWEFDPFEVELLREACATVNDIDALAASAYVERRQQRLVLSRLLGQLALPTDDGKPPRDGKSVRGRAAAEARWRRRNASA